MALAPWNVLAGGKFRTDAEEARRLETGEGGRTMTDPTWLRNEKEKAVSAALEKVAEDVGARQIASGALLLAKCYFCGSDVAQWQLHMFCKRHPTFSQSSVGENQSSCMRTLKRWKSL